jgi:hypothetical protein
VRKEPSGGNFCLPPFAFSAYGDCRSAGLGHVMIMMRAETIQTDGCRDVALQWLSVSPEELSPRIAECLTHTQFSVLAVRPRRPLSNWKGAAIMCALSPSISPSPWLGGVGVQLH